MRITLGFELFSAERTGSGARTGQSVSSGRRAREKRVMQRAFSIVALLISLLTDNRPKCHTAQIHHSHSGFGSRPHRQGVEPWLCQVEPADLFGNEILKM